jgi:Domain of unknown function (DUF4440)
LLIVLIAFSCKQKSALTKEEVIAVINKFDSGWRNKNTKLVDGTLAPTYIYFTQSGNTFSRENVVLTAGSAEYSLDTMSRTEIEVDLFENTAVVSTRWKGKGIYRGNPFNEDQRCSITIIKSYGHVGILSEHCTPIKGGKIFH